MARSLIALAVLPLTASICWAGESISDAQMDRVTAGAAGTQIPSFAGGLFSGSGLPPLTLLSSSMSGQTSTPLTSSSGVSPDLGEAGLVGSARFAEFNFVAQFLGQR